MSKIWKMPSVNVPASLPIPAGQPYQGKAFYSLFKKIDGRWMQVRVSCYPENAALKVYGDIAVSNPSTFSVRKVVFALKEAR